MTEFKAFRLHATDGEPARCFDTITIDDLSAGEVLIKIAYSSINFKDALASRGRNQIIRKYPRIGGIDLVGTVAASSDPDHKPGDEVIVHGFGIGVDHDGGHAQYARVKGEWTLPKPPQLTMLETATLGAAGYTAGLCIYLMELNGLTPDLGPVLVNGATGGVAGTGIDMLSRLGYQVVAMTGKREAHNYLREIGAADVVDRVDAAAFSRPLEKSQWAGALDSVGGATLSWLTRTMLPNGVITSFGNAAGAELNTNVYPFILRGVRLIGVNANSPMPLRREVWKQIATRYRPRHLATIGNAIEMSELPEYLDRMLEGRIQGRTVVRMA